jgi:hypothetical protein
MSRHPLSVRASEPASGAAGPGPGHAPDHRPLYVRSLRLKHLRPAPWQRMLLAEGSLLLPAVLVLGDLASAWLIPVFPVAVAAVVKAHDLLAGLLCALPPRSQARAGAGGESGNATGAAPRGGSAPGGGSRSD